MDEGISTGSENPETTDNPLLRFTLYDPLVRNQEDPEDGFAEKWPPPEDLRDEDTTDSPRVLISTAPAPFRLDDVQTALYAKHLADLGIHVTVAIRDPIIPDLVPGPQGKVAQEATIVEGQLYLEAALDFLDPPGDGVSFEMWSSLFRRANEEQHYHQFVPSVDLIPFALAGFSRRASQKSVLDLLLTIGDIQICSQLDYDYILSPADRSYAYAYLIWVYAKRNPKLKARLKLGEHPPVPDRAFHRLNISDERNFWESVGLEQLDRKRGKPLDSVPSIVPIPRVRLPQTVILRNGRRQTGFQEVVEGIFESGDREQTQRVAYTIIRRFLVPYKTITSRGQAIQDVMDHYSNLHGYELTKVVKADLVDILEDINDALNADNVRILDRDRALEELTSLSGRKANSESSMFRVLNHLMKKGPRNLKELMSELQGDLSKDTIDRDLKALEAKGFVRSSIDERARDGKTLLYTATHDTLVFRLGKAKRPPPMED